MNAVRRAGVMDRETRETDRYTALISPSKRGNTTELRSSADRVQRRLEQEFLAQSLESPPDTTLFALLSIKTEMLLIDAIAKGTVGPAMERGIGDFVASEWFHYRMLQARFKRQRSSQGFTIMFGRFGFAMAAAIVCDAGSIKNWFAHQFKTHYESGYECPHTVDREFLDFCYWIAQRSINSSATDDDLNVNGYLGMTGSPDVVALGAACERRIAQSYKQIVQNEPGAAFYGTRFPALFPFELLAAMKLSNIPVESVASLLVQPFARFGSVDPLATTFNQSCDRSVNAFERVAGDSA